MLKRLLLWIFTERCPNCESAWTGGHPNPEDITFCALCSSPHTSKMRGWVWRLLFLARHNTRINVARLERGAIDPRRL